MKSGAVAVSLSALVQMSCGNPDVTPVFPPPSVTAPQSTGENRKATAGGKGTGIPGFHLPAHGSSASIMPSGEVLLTHWDEIQKQIMARPAGMLRDRLISQSIKQMAAVDPERAALILTEWKNAVASEWFGTAKIVVQNRWKTDPAAAVDFLSNKVPPAMQGGLWHQILAELPPAEAAGWIDRIAHEGGKFRGAASMLARWLQRDPEAAAAWMDRFAATLTPEQLEVVASPNYLFMDGTGLPPLEAARRAFAAAKEPAARRFFADRYLGSVKVQQPDQLSEITARVEAELHGAETQGFREDIALNQMREDPAAYVAELTAEEVKQLPDKFLSETISTWAQKDSPSATRWALALNREQDVVSGVQSWYSLDPSAAAGFAFALPAGKMRDDSLSNLCDQFSYSRDFAAAEKCLAAIEDKTTADRAAWRLENSRKRFSGEE